MSPRPLTVRRVVMFLLLVSASVAHAQPFKAVEHVVVIELSFPDSPFPFSNATTQQSMATLNAYIQEVSYGKRSVVSTVVGPFMSPSNACSGVDRIPEGLALADPFVDYRQFDSFYVIYRDVHNGVPCSGTGGSTFQNDVWSTQDGNVAMGFAGANINSDPNQVWRPYTHEFGHNQGLGHADVLDCGTDSIRDDTLSPTPSTLGPDGCQWIEYGDVSDTMGSGNPTQYNAPHRSLLGFFDPTLGDGNERVQDVTAPATYDVNVLETPATAGPEIKALRIPRNVVGPDGQPEHLWVEYRQPVAGTFDATLDPATFDGVLIHIDNLIPGRSVDSLLVDATPSTPSGDPALRLNHFVYDPVANVSITLVGLTATQATVRVDDGRALACAVSSPLPAYANQPVTFTVTGGTAPFSWSAPGGSPASANGPATTFTTSYSTAETKTVTVSSPSSPLLPAQCTVEIVPLTCFADGPVENPNQPVTFRASGGAEPFSWSAPGGNPSSGGGPSFVTSYSSQGTYTATVFAANGTSAQCQVEILPPRTTGDVWITRTKANGALIGGTSAKLDAVSQGFNPAFFLDVAPGSHTARATALTGYTVLVGQCEYPDSYEECTPDAFSVASCAAGTCSLDVTADAAQTRKVEFRYARWAGFVNHGGSITGTPAVVRVDTNRFDVFARGTDGTLQHQSIIDGIFSGWENLGGPIAGDPAAVSWAPDHIDVFARVTNKRLKHIAWDGSTWTPWSYAGTAASLTGTPTVVSYGPNNLDVYYRTRSKLLRHVALTGVKWSHAATVAKHLVSDPVAISWAPGRVDVFWQGLGNTLVHRGGSGAKTDPIETLATNLAGKPAVASWGPGRIDVVWRGTDNAGYQEGFQSIWWGPQNLGGSLTSDPVVVDRSPGDVEVFILANDGSVAYQVYDHGWSGTFQPLGGNFVGPPVAISIASSRIDVIAIGGDNTLSTDTFQ